MSFFFVFSAAYMILLAYEQAYISNHRAELVVENSPLQRFDQLPYQLRILKVRFSKPRYYWRSVIMDASSDVLVLCLPTNYQQLESSESIVQLVFWNFVCTSLYISLH